ncbi:hypothetical protein D3C76_1637590 [compost metagenome]
MGHRRRACPCGSSITAMVYDVVILQVCQLYRSYVTIHKHIEDVGFCPARFAPQSRIVDIFSEQTTNRYVV